MSLPQPSPRHGAHDIGDGRTHFSVWAPTAERVELELNGVVAGALGAEHDGYHVGIFPAGPGDRYRYLLDGRGPFPDPASRSQPDGVFGASMVVEPLPGERDPRWRGVSPAALVICEVHVGTFSQAGTFAGVAEALEHLAAAGYSAIELMPLASFAGERNWGYDGVFPFSIHEGYGGRAALAGLCAAAHRAGLAVIVDVVDNHFGPEGAVFSEYGPYLTDAAQTPWGPAINMAGPGSDEVRRYFLERALDLVRELGVDGLRLDAVHEIVDQTARPYLAELTCALHAEGRRLGRVVCVIAESPANDPRLLAPPETGGIGMDSVWNDDFHHALRVALTGVQDRFFGDYRGVANLSSAFCEGFVAAERRAPSRGRHHGRRATINAGERFVVFAQNHDQIGNGGLGTRLSAALALAAQFPITAAVLCSGGVPLRFMGEEYGETAPFHFFCDYQDAGLAEAARAGRRAEIGERDGQEAPDPNDPATFAACRPDRSRSGEGIHAELLAWQRELLALRRSEPALGSLELARSSCEYDETAQTFVLVRRADPALFARPIAVVANLGGEPAELESHLLADCRLDVLAARDPGAMTAGERLTPTAGGTMAIRVGAYGVFVAALLEPPEQRRRDDDGLRLGALAPRLG